MQLILALLIALSVGVAHATDHPPDELDGPNPPTMNRHATMAEEAAWRALHNARKGRNIACHQFPASTFCQDATGKVTALLTVAKAATADAAIQIAVKENPTWVPVGPAGGGHERWAGTLLIVGCDAIVCTLSDSSRVLSQGAKVDMKAEAVSLWKAGRFTPSADGK